jgi:hypothetical protein
VAGSRGVPGPIPARPPLICNSKGPLPEQETIETAIKNKNIGRDIGIRTTDLRIQILLFSSGAFNPTKNIGKFSSKFFCLLLFEEIFHHASKI